MPLSRLTEMAENAVATFATELEGSLKEPHPKRFIFANLIDHMACEGLLQDLPRILREMPNREAARNEVAQILHRVATATEKTMELLRRQQNTPVLFVSPPGMLYWSSALQQFEIMLAEVCAARRIELYMCAPNLRVGQDDLRPAALSSHAYSAAISPLLQSIERGGNAQLTWDDAIDYDRPHMRIGRLTFDQEGNRLLPEETLAKREHLRRFNWLVREDHPTTVKADLAAVWDQDGRWATNREVERTIPQIYFAENTETIKLPLVLRLIVAQGAVVLELAAQTRETTYRKWYQERLATVSLPMAARALSV